MTSPEPAMLRLRRGVAGAVLYLMAFAALAIPVITQHPHDAAFHGPAEHHASAAGSGASVPVQGLLEAIRVAVDGCHLSGAWIDEGNATALSPDGRRVATCREIESFLSVDLPVPLRPPNGRAFSQGD